MSLAMPIDLDAAARRLMNELARLLLLGALSRGREGGDGAVATDSAPSPQAPEDRDGFQ